MTAIVSGAVIWDRRGGSAAAQHGIIPDDSIIFGTFKVLVGNRILKRVMPELEHICCPSGQVLLEADSSLDYVFFPHSGVVSVVAVYANGNAIEMATIGREGCSGVQALLGAKISSVRLLVQIPGSAAKMSRAAFTRALDSMPSFRTLMYAYVEAFLEQVLVSVACNGAHTLKERLARWLLMMRDRSDEDTLPITQDILAEMLGAQRPSITNVARELERAGLIKRGAGRSQSWTGRASRRLLASVINWFASGPLFICPKHTRNLFGYLRALVIYITDSLSGVWQSSNAYSPSPTAPQEYSVPLTPFLKEAVFDPKAIEATTAAFEAVCESLQLANQSDPLTELVARKVIEIAGTGERNPQRIRDLVLLALNESGERSA